MRMTGSLRDLTQWVHVTASVGWIGALGVFLAHASAGLLSDDEQIVRAVYLAMAISTWFVILPLSIVSLATGIVQALCTAWGLIRHYWIVFKLLMTAAATGVLLLKLEPISYLAEMAAQPAFSSSDLVGLRTSTMLHAAGGLVVLLMVAGLAIFKPRGLTPFGARTQDKQIQDRAESGGGSREGMPRWVRLFIVASVILILMIGTMLVGGSHGPGAHMPH